MERMKAVGCEKYGPPEVLKFQEIEKPVPNDDEVLIKIHATSVNAADCNVRGLTFIPNGLGFLAKLMLGFNKPKIKILGSVFAGEIEAIGKSVKSLKVGDKVFGSGPQMGTYAEYTCRPEIGPIALMPENISFEQAATVPYGALTALYFIRDLANIKSGQKVLVRGASGGVGVYAVQLSRYFGADVTGVCSTANVEFVKSLGALKVIDYTKVDITQLNEKWDIVIDIVVGKTSFSHFKGILNDNGYYLAIAGGVNDIMQMLWTKIRGGKKVKFGGGESCEKKENLIFLSELIQQGKIKPVLDKTFSFDQIVEAHKYAESSDKKGNIAVLIV